MNVISIEEASFYELIDKIYTELEKRYGTQEEHWVNEATALETLNLRSKSSLSKLRNEDKIRYSHPMKKVILYYKPSLLEYLEKHANYQLSK